MSDPELDFDARWLCPQEADEFFARLTSTLAFRQESVVLFGRSMPQPRLSLWMGDPEAVYRYSGRTFVPVPWDATVADLRHRTERAAEHAFNSVLLNLYRDGRDSMGYHADDEPELGPEPVIASVSLGATRRFVLRPRKRRGSTPALELALSHGSLLVMRGSTQRAWVHGVPKEPAITAPRLNLTFRWIAPRT